MHTTTQVQQSRVLLVEDEIKLGNSISSSFTQNGFKLDLAHDGKVGETYFRTNNYDLVILDINLPFMNGYELCRRIRQSNKEVPIIMLTALGEIQNKLDAFSAGADDYIVKPFHLSELLARANVFLRRKQVSNLDVDVLTISDLEINFNTKLVKRAGKSISLTAKEFALLTLLANSRGRVLSKQEIAEKVWDSDSGTGANTIEVYINFLRNKIDKDSEIKLIHTKTGFGYYLKPN